MKLPLKELSKQLGLSFKKTRMACYTDIQYLRFQLGCTTRVIKYWRARRLKDFKKQKEINDWSYFITKQGRDNSKLNHWYLKADELIGKISSLEGTSDLKNYHSR